MNGTHGWNTYVEHTIGVRGRLVHLADLPRCRNDLWTNVPLSVGLFFGSPSTVEMHDPVDVKCTSEDIAARCGCGGIGTRKRL